MWFSKFFKDKKDSKNNKEKNILGEEIKPKDTIINAKSAEKKSTDKLDFNHELEKVFKGMRSLFDPFKDLVIKILPSFGVLFIIIEAIIKLIVKILIFIAILLNIFARTLKTTLFKYTALTVIVAFTVVYISFYIISKNANSESSKEKLIAIVEQNYQYQMTISGDIDIRPFPVPRIVLRNIVLEPLNQQQKININKIKVKNITLTSSWFSIITGNFDVKTLRTTDTEIEIEIQPANAQELIINSSNISSEIENYILQAKSNPVITNYNQDNMQNRKISWYFSSINPALKDFSLINTKITLVGANSENLVSWSNIDINATKSKNKYDINGRYIVNGNQYIYLATLEQKDNGASMDVKIANNQAGLKQSPATIIANFSYSPTLKLDGTVELKNDYAIEIAKWLGYSKTISISEAKNYNASLSFLLEDQQLHINNFIIKNGNAEVNGNANWLLSAKSRPLLINITNISDEFWLIVKNNISEFNASSRDKLMQNISESLSNKMKSVNNFIPAQIIVLKGSIHNNKNDSDGEIVDFAVIGKVFDKTLYFERFNYTSKSGGTVSMVGTLDITNAKLQAMLKANLNESDILSLTNSDNIAPIKKMINGKSINLEALLSADRNMLTFTNTSGTIAGYNVFGSTFAFNIGEKSTSLVADIKTDKITFEDIDSISTEYFTGFINTYQISPNLRFLGIEPTQSIRLDISSQNFIYKNLPFTNAEMSINLRSNGAQVSRFSARSSRNGSISGTLSMDMSSNPSIIGNLTTSGLFIDAKQLKGIMFKNYNLSGNMIVDSSLRFSGVNMQDAISRASGNIIIQKQERVLSRESTNIPGFHLSIQRLRGNNYLIKDIFANISINNGKLDIYPATISAENIPGNFRGGIKGTINIANETVDSFLQIQNIQGGAQRAYTIKGSWLNPIFKSATPERSSVNLSYKQPEATTSSTVSPLDRESY